MKKITLLILYSLISSISIFAKEQVPAALLGNWLVPETNAWKFGITEHYVVAEGAFWEYEVLSNKPDLLVLSMFDGTQKKNLYITPAGPKTALIGYSQNTRALFTTTVNGNPKYGGSDLGFAKPVLKTGAVQLKGVLNGYDPKRAGYGYIMIVYNQLLADVQKIITVKVDSLGRFETNFPLLNPQEMMIRFGDELTELHLGPGQKLMVSIDLWTKPLDDVEQQQYMITKQNRLYMGDQAVFNTAFNDFQYRLRRMQFLGGDEDPKQTEQFAYKKNKLKIMNQMLDSLKSYNHHHHPGKKFIQYFSAFIRYQSAKELLSYRWANGKQQLKPEYFDFLKALPLNDEVSLVTTAYSSVLKDLGSGLFAEDLVLQAPTIDSVIKLAKSQGESFTPEQEAMLRDNVVLFVHGPESMGHSHNADVEINDANAIESMYVGFRKHIELQEADYMKPVLKRLGIIPGTLVFELIAARKALVDIDSAGGFSESKMRELKITLKNPVLYHWLEQYNENLQVNSDGTLAKAI